jgi:hypothetical protein
MDIVVTPEQTITLQEPIVIEAVRDVFTKQRITARIKGLPRAIILWDGPEEYAAAGDWTNETATAQAVSVLSLPVIPWL